MEQQPHNPVPIELENQYLLRLPEEPAAALRKAIQKGDPDLKRRLSIQIEPDNPAINQCIRKGNVKFDEWKLHAKLVDLPTIVESHKTIDKKTLYKTADICQMLICKEGEPSDDEIPEEEEKKKDPNKVEKKYVYPHGVCPPLKNCRKRRFRKTLKKKHCLDEPEIEKEVKRLFRTDYEAVDVKWQLLTEEELTAGKGGSGANPGAPDASIGEQDLFGALSDIEEDDGPDTDKLEAPSEGDSTMYGELDRTGGSGSQLVTQFSKDMFKPKESGGESSSSQVQPSGGASGSGQDAVALKLGELNAQINELRKQKQDIERNLLSCPNLVLQQKLREGLMETEARIQQRQMEIDALSMFNL